MQDLCHQTHRFRIVERVERVERNITTNEKKRTAMKSSGRRPRRRRRPPIRYGDFHGYGGSSEEEEDEEEIPRYIDENSTNNSSDNEPSDFESSDDETSDSDSDYEQGDEGSDREPRKLSEEERGDDDTSSSERHKEEIELHEEIDANLPAWVSDEEVSSLSGEQELEVIHLTRVVISPILNIPLPIPRFSNWHLGPPSNSDSDSDSSLSSYITQFND